MMGVHGHSTYQVTGVVHVIGTGFLSISTLFPSLGLATPHPFIHSFIH